MIHKRWIASIITPVEAAIIHTLRGIITQGMVAHKEFEDEVYHVFETQVRKSLRNPSSDGAIKFKSLEKYPDDVIQNGFRQLENRFVDGQPMVLMPQNAKYASYSGTSAGGGVKAKDGLRWKRAKNAYAPLMVHEKLIYPESVQMETAIDQFIREMLIISGNYVDRRVFSGLDHANPTNSATDSFFLVKSSDTVNFKVRNPHRITRAEQNIIFGDDFEEKEVDPEQRTLFPADQDWLEFDETSKVEQVVASAAHARVPLDPVIEAVFKTAHTTYR